MAKNFPLLFKNSVVDYLKAVKPEYVRRRFELVEHELQGFFLARLIGRKIPVFAERRYNRSRRRYDILIRRQKIYVEVEWDAKLTDGFTKRTFEDLRKLRDLVPVGSKGMFLAVNISRAYPGWMESEGDSGG